MSFKDNLIKIEPYTAGEQPAKKDFIKLNANENPYPPSPEVIKALENFKKADLRKYPSMDSDDLRKAIAEYLGLDMDNIFCGNGSDDVLAACFQAFFCSGKPVIYPEITYSFYPVWSEMFGVKYETFPLNDDYTIDPENYNKPNGGVIICNPNAPTSIGEPLSFVEGILKNNPDSVVICDEAYIDFGRENVESAVPLIEKYENLCVVQTFSKSRALAGMRIGFAAASKTLINALRAAKDSYNSYPLDSMAITAGIAAVKDTAYFKETVAKVCAERDRTAEELRKLGFFVPDSSTNFLFASHPEYKASAIYEYLKTKDVYVRYFKKPKIDNFLRITIGTRSDMDAMLDGIKEMFSK